MKKGGVLVGTVATLQVPRDRLPDASPGLFGLRTIQVTPQKFSADCDRDTNRPTTIGEWTLTYIRVKGKWVYLYRAVDSSGALPSLGPNAMQQRLSAFRAKARTIRTLGSSTPTRTPRLPASHRTTRTTQSRGRSGGELWTSTGAISQQCTGTGSPGHQAAGPASQHFADTTS